MPKRPVSTAPLPGLGKRLQRVLTERDVSVTQLAEAIDVSRQTIHRAISGDAMSRGVAQAAAKFLDIPEDWLLYGVRKTPAVSESGPEYHVGVPSSAADDDAIAFGTGPMRQRAKAQIETILADLAEAGADDEFLGWSRRLLTSPNNYALYVGGQRDEMDDEQKLRHMKGLAVGVRQVLDDRLRRTSAK